MNLLKHATWLLVVVLASGCASLSLPDPGKDKAYRITVNFSSFAALTQYPLTVVMIGFLFFVIYSRGNVAKLIPPRLNRILR